MDIILPNREAAQRKGWTHQVQWMAGKLPCFVRCKSGAHADVVARDIKQHGGEPVVIDLHDALQLH